MDAKVKEEWVAALRSGRYAQTREQLRDNSGYCCLGVLCDLAAANGLGNWEFDEFVTDRLDEDGFHEGGKSLPPQSIVSWAGLPSEDPQVNLVHPVAFYATVGTKPTLATLNDHGYTFEQIADIIEKEL